MGLALSALRNKSKRGNVYTRQYRVFIEYLIEALATAGMSQQALAVLLRRPQFFVAKYEYMERRLDVVEFLVIAKLLGAVPHEIVRAIEDAA